MLGATDYFAVHATIPNIAVIVTNTFVQSAAGLRHVTAAELLRFVMGAEKMNRALNANIVAITFVEKATGLRHAPAAGFR